MKKRILAVGAHQDDIELRAGGTLARFAGEGHEVIYAVASTTPHYPPMSGNGCQAEILSNHEIIDMRKGEASKGAGIIGASEVHFFDFKSLYWYREGTCERVYLDGVNCTSEDLGYLEEQIPGREFLVSAHRVESAVRFVADFIEKKKADIVLTHSADDCHWEHYSTANLILSAVRRLEQNGLSRGLFGWEFGGMGTLHHSFFPGRFEDITGTIDIKCRALEVFKSQFKDRDPSMFPERARARAKYYGNLCGYAYAEPFVEFNKAGLGAGEEVVLPETYKMPSSVKGIAG